MDFLANLILHGQPPHKALPNLPAHLLILPHSSCYLENGVLHPWLVWLSGLSAGL